MARGTMRLKVTGLKQTVAALRKLPEEIQHDVVSEALVESAEPMRALAEQLAPRESGGLARSVKIRNRPDERYRVRSMVVALSQLGHLNEFGTGPRYHANGKYVGEMPAHPFMRPAYDAEKTKTIHRFKPALWQAILSAVYRVQVK